MTEDSKPIWPTLIHGNGAWVEAYDHGWRQLQALWIGEAWSAADRLPWAIYCARYLWQQWPIEAALDFLYTKDSTITDNNPPLALLEWECFRLTGHRERLQRCFPLLWRGSQPLKNRETQSLSQIAQTQSLAQNARTLGYPLSGMDHPKDVLPDLHNVGEEWQNPPTARKAMGGWLEERLLLLALLPWDQDTERRQRLAQIAVDLCVSHEELHFYLPPLLLDHIIGCQPDGEERFLTWQLYADPPIGVERYPLGNVSLSLYAKQEKGEGTHLLIETSAPVAVEIVTAERTYLELLAAGQHDLTLTVLDRTDVR